MSPVRRREPRRGKRWVLPVSLVAALAVLAGAWLLLKDAPEELPQAIVAHPVTISDREAADITRIAISNPYDAPYALTGENGNFYMEDERDFAMSDVLLDDMVENAALLVASDTVGDRAEHPEWALENFGLGEDAVRVTVDFADGGRLAFAIGDSVPQETPAYYLAVEGDSHVYTVTPDVYEAYTYTRLGLHDVTDPALKGELIDRIAFEGGAAFTAERQADGWMLVSPFRYPLDEGAVNALLAKLEKLRFALWEGKAEDVDLAACGLQPPRRTLTLTVAESLVTGYDENDQPVAGRRLPAYDLTFGLGDSVNDVVFYCLYRGEVVQATAFSAGFLLTQEYAPLLLTAPFNAPTNDLRQVIWEEDGRRTVYDISLQERVLPNNDLETDENGNILYDLAVLRDGEKMDSDAFLTAYGELLSLRTADRLPAGYALPETAPSRTITVARSQSAREVAFYPLDALHEAVAVDGVAVFQVERTAAEGIARP